MFTLKIVVVAVVIAFFVGLSLSILEFICTQGGPQDHTLFGEPAPIDDENGRPLGYMMGKPPGKLCDNSNKESLSEMTHKGEGKVDES